MLPETNAPDANNAATEGSTPPPSQDNFVTPDALKAAISPLEQSLQTLNSSLAALAAAKSAPVGGTPLPETPEPTDEEIVADLRDGNISKLKSLISGATNKVRRDELAPLQHQFATIGASLAKEVAVLSGKLPHYTRYQKEIDNIIASLPPSDRANPACYQLAHQTVVGMHIQDIIKEEVDKAVRQAREPETGRMPSGSSRQVNGQTTTALPSMEEVFGSDAAMSIQHLGKTPDEWAKKQGFKSMDEMIAHELDFRKSQGAAANA